MGSVSSAVKSNPKWIAGMTSVGAGVVALIYSSSKLVEADSAESLGDRIAKNIELACHSFVNENQLDEVDPEKLKQSFQTIRGAKDASSGKEELSLDDFKKMAKIVGIENDEVAKSMFEALDTDKSGTVDLREFSVMMAARAGPGRLRVLFGLCDLDHSGGVSREELSKTLSSLFASVNKLTLGELLRSAKAGTNLTPDQVREAFVQGAINEIFTGVGPKGNVDLKRFSAWVEGGTPASRATVCLFDSFRGAVGNKSFLSETRYGAYAFLVARFTKTASAGVRYLAFTSDVGEAFRPVVPVALVNLTYAIAIGYCIVDVAYVGYQESKKKEPQVTRTVAERTAFQALASVILPFLIIHTQVHIFHKLLHARGGALAKFGPTVAGLALIPLLPKICDEPVEHAVASAFDSAWPVPGHGPRAAPHEKAH